MEHFRIHELENIIHDKIKLIKELDVLLVENRKDGTLSTMSEKSSIHN